METEADADEWLPLSPSHAALFRTGAVALSDGIGWPPETGEIFDTGFAAFDRLTPSQKQTAILEVSRALLLPDATKLRLTAALAATIAAIYGEYQGLLACEIDGGEGSTADRVMLLTALKEVDLPLWQ